MNPAYWPEPGFFASSHTENYVGLTATAHAEQAIAIDGKWSPSEFSRLHNKFSDVYALSAALKLISDQQTRDDTVKKIAQTVRDKFWRGGGSYVGFYDDLDAEVGTPLELDRVQYASPGEIVFSGDQSILDGVLAGIDSYSTNEDDADGVARSINKILAREKIKTAKIGTEFSSNAIEAYVKSRTDELLSLMGVDNTEHLLAACVGDVAIYAKVAMAHYRRMKDLRRFVDQGRLKFKQ